jgi:PKD repeat protein
LTPLTGCIPTQAPTAAFDATPTTGTVPLTVAFTDTSSGNGSAITSWSWSFGDGDTSTDQNPSHTYDSVGTFDVSLTVTSEAGSNTTTSTGLITVAQATVAPTAAFTATNTTGETPLTVQFTDQTTFTKGADVTYAWDFGDGGTSSEQNPSHTYTGAGTFDVSLTVTNSVGSDTATQTDLVTATAPVEAPTAEFSGTPRQGQVPLTVQFTDESDPGSSPITSRNWDFRDGYTAGGTVDFTLTLEYLGAEDVSALGIQEDLPDGWTFDQIVNTSASQSPQIKDPSESTSGNLEIFWVDTPDLTGPLTVTYRVNAPAAASDTVVFTGTTIFRTTGSEIRSNVETTMLAPRGTSTQEDPQHVFQTPGTYTIDLSVTSAVGGDGRTRSNYIQAQPADLVPFEGEVDDLLLTMTRELDSASN